jgi:hypothetical protein
MTSFMTSFRLAVACSAALALALAVPGIAAADSLERNFAGSIQLDYMAVPSESIGRKIFRCLRFVGEQCPPGLSAAWRTARGSTRNLRAQPLRRAIGFHR